MRAAFIISFLANLVLALVSLSVLPDRVAVHFGAGGMADGWASSLESTLMMLGMHVLLFCLLFFSPSLVAQVPGKWISLPNREYWLSPERRERAIELLSHYIWQFGTALYLFMFVVGLLTLRANLSEPVRLNEPVFLAVLLIFLLYTGYWTIALIRAFRIPRQRQ